jgi:hypothetical protein
MELEHKFKQEDEILKAQLNQGLDADKAAIDNVKARVELEKEGIKLEEARVNAVTSIAKNVGGVVNA